MNSKLSLESFFFFEIVFLVFQKKYFWIFTFELLTGKFTLPSLQHATHCCSGYSRAISYNFSHKPYDHSNIFLFIILFKCVCRYIFIYFLRILVILRLEDYQKLKYLKQIFLDFKTKYFMKILIIYLNSSFKLTAMIFFNGV